MIAFLVDYCWHYARGTFVVDVEEAAKKPSNTVDAMPPMSRVTSDEDAILEIKERHSSLGVVDVGL